MMIRRRLGLFGVLFLGLFIILVVLSKSLVSAAVNVGSTLTTTPITDDIVATPGSTVSTKLQVLNDSPNPLIVNVHVEEFKAAGTNGQALFYNPPPTDPSLSWVHLSQTSLSAEPGVWNSVTMTISLPKQAAQGYYYAVIFSPSVAIPGSKNTNELKSANAAFILVDSNNSKDITKLGVDNFSVGSRSYNYLPATFSINVANTGNIFTVPSGEVYISRTLNGPSIDSLNINPGGGNILPQTNRIFNLVWSDGFPVYKPKTINGQEVSGKNGKPIEQLSWNLSNITKFRFGKYYAKFVLVYSNGSRDIPITGEVSFWVIPWLFIIVFVIVISFIAFGIWSIVRSIIRRIKKIAKRR